MYNGQHTPEVRKDVLDVFLLLVGLLRQRLELRERRILGGSSGSSGRVSDSSGSSSRVGEVWAFWPSV